MNTGEIIKKLREEKGLTQEQLGKLIGVQKSAVAKYERGLIQNLKRQTIEKLAEIFGVRPSYIMGLSDSDLPRPGTIPVLGTVPCGIPAEAIEDIEEYIDYIGVPGHTYYGLRAKGDSMSPEIRDGDIMIIDSMPDVPSGSIAIVKVNGDDATCKKLLKSKAGITLVPLNNAYDPIFITAADCQSLPVTVMGKVQEVRHRF
ncbi:MAG: LexA family protein [Bulleidia sp.]